MEAQADEEPEGKILVGLGEEALRPPSMNTKIGLLSFSWCILAAAPSLVICFTLEASLATKNLRKMKGKLRSLRSVLLNRPNLIGPIPGWKKEGHLYWMKIKLKGYFARYFSFPSLLAPIFSSGVLLFFFSVLASDHVLELNGLSIFHFRVCIYCDETRGRPLKGWGQSTGGWRPSADRMCCSQFKGRRPVWPSSKAVAQPELSVSVGLPKRHKRVATATVSSPNAQVSEAIVPKPKGGGSVHGSPHLSISQYKEEAIPAEMESLRINVGDTKWVSCCCVKGCTEGPSTSQAAICTHVCQAHLDTKLSFPSCPHTFFNTDTLQYHGKLVHPSGSLDPI